MIDTTDIRSFDVPRTILALFLIIGASVLFGEALLRLIRFTFRRFRRR